MLIWRPKWNHKELGQISYRYLYPPKWVKCLCSHLTKECSQPRNTDAKCTICGGPHLASYRVPTEHSLGSWMTLTHMTENRDQPQKSNPYLRQRWLILLILFLPLPDWRSGSGGFICVPHSSFVVTGIIHYQEKWGYPDANESFHQFINKKGRGVVDWSVSWTTEKLIAYCHSR